MTEQLLIIWEWRIGDWGLGIGRWGDKETRRQGIISERDACPDGHTALKATPKFEPTFVCFQSQTAQTLKFGFPPQTRHFYVVD